MIKSISKEKLQQLEEVLNDTWSGKLNHVQREYYCGTAACAAGWYTLRHSETKFNSPAEAEDVMLLVEEFNDPAAHPYQFCIEDIGLTYGEAELLFNEGTTQGIQKACLAALKSLRRLELEKFIVDPEHMNLIRARSFTLIEFTRSGEGEFEDDASASVYYGAHDLKATNDIMNERLCEFITGIRLPRNRVEVDHHGTLLNPPTAEELAELGKIVQPINYNLQ
ncbi:MAG: hypothetical protein AAFY17_10640 [Cyanobacteria bacterium J06642_11]